MSFGWRFRRFVSSRIIRKVASPRRRTRARAKFEAERKKTNAPHEVFYFHEIADPYGALLAQILDDFCARFDIKLTPHLAGAPPSIADPEPSMRVDYARHDAASIAPFYGLTFTDAGKTPDPGNVELVARILAHQKPEDFSSVAAECAPALWGHDRQALEVLAQAKGMSDRNAAQVRLEEGTALRRKLGHYAGAMLFYGGEWYWGIDRLHYLEERLAALGLRKPGAPTGTAAPRKRNAPARIEGAASMKLEFFPSLRSPYTCLAFDRVLELPKRYPVELVLRPVLPMVMRGMKIPPAKGFYIFSDCMREAETLGIDFGRFLDPIGPPVRRGFSLYPFAHTQGKGAAYLNSFVKAAFTEARDVYGRRGLRFVVERAGLSWEEARAHLDNVEWEEEIEVNREGMFAAGLWGVPSFILKGPGDAPDFAIWGQDRIWLVEEEIAKRA